MGLGQARSWSRKAVQGEFQAASWAKYKERGAQQSYCDKWGSQTCRICEQALGWVRRTHPTRPPRDPAQPRERGEVVGPPLAPLGPHLPPGEEAGGEEPPGKVSSVLSGCVLGGVCGRSCSWAGAGRPPAGTGGVWPGPGGGGSWGADSGRTRQLQGGSWGAGGGPTPATSVSREARFPSVEVWGPPPGGNPTSIQAGGVYPSGQHRGPSVTLAWKISEKKTRRTAGIGGQLRPQQGSDHLGEAAPTRDPGMRGCSVVNSGLLGFPRKPGPEHLVFLWGPWP